MVKVCEKAIERVSRLEDEETYLELCFKHLVCPKCGEDIERTFVGDRKPFPHVHRYLYKCKDCGWEEERPI